MHFVATGRVHQELNVLDNLDVAANVFLLCWYYDRLKFILPFSQPPAPVTLALPEGISRKFPKAFFAGAAATVAVVVLTVTNAFDIMPRNTLADCRSQFNGRRSHRTQAGYQFCDCIHRQGQPLDQALDAYHKAPDDAP